MSLTKRLREECVHSNIQRDPRRSTQRFIRLFCFLIAHNNRRIPAPPVLYAHLNNAIHKHVFEHGDGRGKSASTLCEDDGHSANVVDA